VELPLPENLPSQTRVSSALEYSWPYKVNLPYHLIPTAPPAVALTGIGGGLFFRPEAIDLMAVTDAVSVLSPALGFMLDQRGLPPTDAGFAVMAYAGVAMVASGPVSAFEGYIFLELTDSYVDMTAAGTLIKQGASLTAGLNANLNWSTLSMSGLLAAKIDYAPALTGQGDLGFSIAVTGNPARIVWAVNGGFDALIVGIDASGNLTVSPAGFYAGITIGASFPSPIISFDGQFEAQTWVIPNYNQPQNSELGAYASLEISVSVAGGLATATGLAEGTFILKDGKTTLFLLGMVTANVVMVFEGSVIAFLEFHNNELTDSGILFEMDENLSKLIEEAQKMAEDMNSKSQEALSNVESAGQVYDTGLSDEILARAGQNLYELPSTGFSNLIRELAYNARMSMPETFLYTPYQFGSVPQGIRWVFNEIRYGEEKPDESVLSTAENAMRSRLAEATSLGEGVRNTINANRALAVEWNNQSSLSFQTLTSPVGIGTTSSETLSGIQIQSSIPFTVNEQTAQQMSGNLIEAAGKLASFKELEPGYLEAIQTTTNNLARLDVILRGSGTAPGIVEQGRRYSLARQSVGEYYARRADYFYEVEQWANTKQQLLYSQAGNIQVSINQTATAYQNMNINTASDRCAEARTFLSFSSIELPPRCGNRQELAQLVAMSRRKTILQLSGASAVEIRTGVRALSASMTNYRNNGQTAAFNAAFVETGYDLWYDMFDQGLKLIATDSRQKAQATNADRLISLTSLDPADRDFTRSLNELYLIRAQMTENLYSMIDAYLEARANANLPMNTTTVTRLSTQRQRLANALLPPVITSLNVDARLQRQMVHEFVNGRFTQRFRDRRFSKANITWLASHPTRIVEYSLGIRYRSPSITSSRMFSVGNTTSFNHWVHKGYTEGSFSPGNPSPFFLLLRARGEAGYTSSRLMRFQVPVEGNPEWYSGTGPVITSSLPAATSIPSTPVITLIGGVSTVGSITIPAFWWNDAGKINLELVSSDTQTGIQKFEIAIGTSSTTQNLLPWTPVTGIRTTIGNTVKIEAVVRNLKLPQGSSASVFVQVRAVNGANATSQISTIRVFTDDSAPTISTLFTPTAGTSLQPGPNQTNITRHLIRLPFYSDPESGITRLEWIVSPTRINPVSRFDAGNYNTTWNSAFLSMTPSFADSSFVYVRALNRAGTHSDISVLAYQTRDLTLPPVSATNIKQVLNGLAVIINTSVTDPETGLQGMQFAIGTKPGLSDIRNWPAGITPDFQPGNHTSGFIDGQFVRYFFLANDELPLGREFYISIRSINGQNVFSSDFISGPFIITDTPPSFNDFSASITGNEVILSGSVTDQSGVIRVRIRLENNDTGAILLDGDLYKGRPANGLNLESVFLVSGISTVPVVKVSLFAENAAGLNRAIRQEIVQISP
jgi:large repetitive protein